MSSDGSGCAVGKPNSSSRRGPRSRIVPIELLLQIRLGVLDLQERAQRSRELLATCGAGGEHGTVPTCRIVRTARRARNPWRDTSIALRALSRLQ